MDHTMKELMPIVIEAAKKYTGNDSTSITYETVQMLMEGVIYCVQECAYSDEKQLIAHELSLLEQYQIGRELILKKTQKILQIFNELSENFEDYEVRCLRDTVQKGIPEFLKWYDAKYFPQQTILTLDYPILEDIHLLKGADAVYKFICGVKLEQKFLKEFPRDYVVSVLEAAVPEYQNMMENICSVFLTNIIGHLVLEKPLTEEGFCLEEYEKLRELFAEGGVFDIEAEIQKRVTDMIEKRFKGNQEMIKYFRKELHNISVRVDAAAKNHKLDHLFVF